MSILVKAVSRRHGHFYISVPSPENIEEVSLDFFSHIPNVTNLSELKKKYSSFDSTVTFFCSTVNSETFLRNAFECKNVINIVDWGVNDVITFSNNATVYFTNSGTEESPLWIIHMANSEGEHCWSAALSDRYASSLPLCGSSYSEDIYTKTGALNPMMHAAFNNLQQSDCLFFGSKINNIGFAPVIVSLSDSDYAKSKLLYDGTSTSNDPYDQGGNTGGDSTSSQGGTGNFSGDSDDIDIPPLPDASTSAAATGFITLYNPTLGQIQNLASYMWSDLFDIATFKKIFADPMDCILGLSIIPVPVPDGAVSTVKVGNISTGITMTKAASQYVEIDCGTINIEEYWGAYLDYAPYTECELYLPFCGIHPIDVDDVMGKPVHVVYHVDILSGACVAYVKCGNSVLYQFIGQCSASVPITSNNFTNMINGILNIAGSVGTMVASGGMSAPVSAAMGANLAGSVASNAMNMKPSIERSGSMSGAGGIMAIKKPYLILTRPNQCKPDRLNAFTGYPTFITRTLSTLSGFTKVHEIHLEGIAASDSELTEIENLLKGGVII